MSTLGRMTFQSNKLGTYRIRGSNSCQHVETGKYVTWRGVRKWLVDEEEEDKTRGSIYNPNCADFYYPANEKCRNGWLYYNGTQMVDDPPITINCSGSLG